MHHIYWFLLRLLPGSFRQPFAGMDGDTAAVSQLLRALINAELSRRLTRRISELSQKVFSRETLKEMILKLDLYPDESGTVPMEDLIEKCRTKAIQITNKTKEPSGNSMSIQLAFRHKDHAGAISAPSPD